MVGIVTGNGLGLQSSSSRGLGDKGVLGSASFGQNGESVYVNAANGNLMIQDRDQLLLGQGLNGAVYRAYNSLAQLTGGNWREGATRSVGELTGTVNTAGSTLIQTDWDGSRTLYVYDTSRGLYVSTAGVGVNVGDAQNGGLAPVTTTGARATIRLDAANNHWVWFDGQDQASETYDVDNGGHMRWSVDADGNSVSYAYNTEWNLVWISTGGGDRIYFGYDEAGRLTSLLSAYKLADGQTTLETSVRYSYDGLGRLSSVIVDLTPQDSSIADGRVFTTTYTYDGDSSRLASMTESDGARLAFTYVVVDGQYRVATVTQAGDGGIDRVTQFQYDLANRQTTVIDPLGFQQQLSWDAAGRLTGVKNLYEPRDVRFQYDAAGNLASQTDSRLGGITLTYDAKGNLIQQTGGLTGVTRTYGSHNELLTETVIGPLPVPEFRTETTRYAYDAKGHLRYVVSAEGRVTEYRYNASGQRVSEIHYASAIYDVSGMADASALPLASLDAWIGALANRQDALRIDSIYDWRGNLTLQTRYERLLADGTGDTSGTMSQMRYVYDPQGRLLQRYVGTTDQQQVEQFTYDGLGRLLSSTSFDGALTTYQYDDTHHTVSVTFASGLTRTSTYNAAGELVSSVDSAQGQPLSQVRNWYDPDGRLRMSMDADGRTTHYLYNARNQRVAVIGPDGTLTETVYDAGTAMPTKVVTYATRLDAAQLATLVDASGQPVVRLPSGATLTLQTSSLTPAVTAADRWVVTAYRIGSMIDHTIDSDGVVTQYGYDGFGNLISKTVFANRVDPNVLPSSGLPAADVKRDRTIHYLYDRDGLLRGEIDPQGYLTETRYNAAGERTEVIRYATPVYESLRNSFSMLNSPTLSMLIPAANARDIVTRFVYDARGLLSAEIDGEGYVTRYRYDAQGNVVERVRGQRVAQDALTQPQQVALDLDLSGAAGSQVRVLVDGVEVGMVTLTSAGLARYELLVPNLVPLAVHSITFSGPGTVAIRGVTLNGHPFSRVVATPSSSSMPRYTLDTAALLASAPAAGDVERTTYAYDSMGRLLEQFTYATTGTSSARYTYDKMGRVLTETQGTPPLERTTTYEYDVQGRLVRKYSPDGSWLQATIARAEASGDTATAAALRAQSYSEVYTYDAAGLRTSSTDENGRKTLYYYDAYDRLVATVNAAGEVVQQSRDAFGDLEQTTVYAVRLSAGTLAGLQGGRLTDDVAARFAALDGADTSRTRFSYSTTGRLLRQTDALGQATDYLYDAFGDVVWKGQDIGGGAPRRITGYDYDRVGHQVWQAVDPSGLALITTATYDAFGRLIQSVDANGVSRSSDYDRDGRIVAVRDGTGQTLATYDAFGNVLTRTDRLGNTTRYAYDATNRQIRVTTPEGIVTTTTYNQHGQVVAVTDGRGNTITNEYDINGELVKTTSPTSVLTYTYDHAGQRLTEGNAQGVTTQYTYDVAGRVMTRTQRVSSSEPGLTMRYEYDAKGQLIRTTDPSGVVTENGYDAAGHQVSVVKDPNGQQLKTVFTYDATGQVLTVAEGAGSAVTRLTANTYDGAGRLLDSVVDPYGLKLTTHYEHDGVGNTLAVIDPTGAVTRYVFDAAGRQTWSVGPTGAVTHFVRDSEGRIVSREAFATQLNLVGLPAKLTEAQLSAAISRSANDEVDYSVYDADGRLRYAVDALGHVKEQVYDAAGNVMRVVAYNGAISAAAGMHPQDVAARLQGLDTSAAHVTYMVHDGGNRLIATIDAGGTVSRNVYDANGNVAQRVQYAVNYVVSGDIDAASLEQQMQAWSREPWMSYQGQVTNLVHDQANRLRYTVDAEGYVTENRYDGAGHLTQVIRYAKRYSDASAISSPDQMAALLADPAALDQAAITSYRYDSAGRLVETTDAQHVVTQYKLDELGRVTDTTVAAGAGEASTTHVVYDRAGNMVEKTVAYGTAVAATTRYRYDGVGRLTNVVEARGVELAEQDTPLTLAQRKAHNMVDGNGNALSAAALSADQKRFFQDAYTSSQSYDAAGRLIAKADPLGNVTRYQYDAFGNQVTTTDPMSATTVSFYDKLNRVVAQVSPENSVVGTQYDAFGNVYQVTDYHTTRQGAIDDTWKRDGWRLDVSQVLPPSNPADAVTRMEYDKLGRLTTSTDAEGHVERYGYDGFGNRTSYTNKLGGTFAYAYDRMGRRVSETLPVLSNGQPVVNRYEYDARGNRITSIESQGLAEERVTHYGYDLLDRQVGTTRQVWLISSAETVTEQSRYDARGNLVAQVDANGHTTTWYYDAAGRKSGEVSAAGTLTLWEYDTAGNMTRTRIFGDPVQATQGGQPPAPVDANNVRETRLVYDSDGRLIQSRVMSVTTGLFDTSNPNGPTAEHGEYLISPSTDLVTAWEYDGRGAVIAKTDPAGGRTVYFYNGSGQKTLEIDPMHYGIAYQHDAQGNVTQETRFAKQYPDEYTSNPSLSQKLIDSWPRSADDRITVYTWDRNGRKTSESRLNVQYGTLDGNGKLTQQVGPATTQYAYDGDGHLLRQIDANGNQYDYGYDALGHRTSEVLPSFVDYQGRMTRATTLYEYDGLGNVTKETRKGDVDQVTSYVYGAGGRMRYKVDAAGVGIASNFDAVGNVIGVAQARNDADGQTLYHATAMSYDEENREIVRTEILWRPEGTQDGISTKLELRYDAYGEVVARRTNGGGPNGEFQEYADYDNAGRVVRTNFNDGVSHLYMYDRNGNATLKVESMESDLRSFTIKTGDDLMSLLKRVDMMQTFTRYDSRNQVAEIRQPRTSASVPRISFNPVDIQIDGGVFANTVLTINGLGAKSSRPVPGPAYTDPAGLSLQMAGSVTAGTSVAWQMNAGYAELHGITVNVPSLQSMYGAYQLEIAISYHVTGEIYAGSRTSGPIYAPVDVSNGQTLFTAVNQSGAITLPIKDTYFQELGSSGSYASKPLRLDYSVQIYVRPQNGSGGRILLGQVNKGANLYEPPNGGSGWVTWAPADALNASFALQSVSNRLTLANSSLPQGAGAMLYYRPNGSGQAFSMLGRDPGSSPASYTTDIGNLPNGDYEMIFMAVSDGSDGRAAGTLLRRDSYVLHVEHGGNSVIYPTDAGASRAGYTVDATGNYLWTAPQVLNLYAPYDSNWKPVDILVVKVRQKGTAQWGAPQGIARDQATGAFRVDLSGYGPGDWDIEIDEHNAAWQYLDTVMTSVSIPGGGGSPSVSPSFLADLQSSVVFYQPPETDYIMVSWEQDGQTHYSRVTRPPGGSFIWNVSQQGLIPQPGQSYTYAIKFTSYDSAGRPLSMGAGNITLGGYGVTNVTLTGSSLPTILQFRPSGLDGLPLTNARTLTLYYRASTEKDHDYDRPFTEVTLTPDAAGRFLFDASALPTNAEFEYRYVAKDAAGNTLAERESYFLTGTRNNPATNVDIAGAITQTTRDTTIDRLQDHNAFGEVSAEVDGRGNLTSSFYNTMGNLVLKREPQVSVTLSNGVKVQTQPETHFYYDLTGNLIGTKDADGNLSTQQWNYGTAKPSVARIWDPLGYAKTMQYDGLGNLRTSYDEIGRRTDYQYDGRNRLIEVDRPALADGRRSIDRYEYDSLDQRIAHTDAMGGRERTYYDAAGRIIKTVSAAGREVRYDYRWASNLGSAGSAVTGGWVRTTTDANGRTSVDQNDVFGRLIEHTDLGGHVFRYAYNWAGLLSAQRGSSGQSVDYTYYSSGLVRSVIDNTTKTQSLYEYDGDGNRTAEFFQNFGDSYVFSQSAVTYDALNRVTAIEDNAYKVYYEYDAVGNRRRMRSVYTDMVGQHQQTQDYWYEYDALNRFTVSMGSLSGAPATDPNDTSVRIVAGAAGGDGVHIEYDAAGERKVAVYAKDGRTERYDYDSNGYLTTQTINNVVVQERRNDLLGRVTNFVERDSRSGQQVTGIDRTWDADGMITQERDNLHRSTTSYTRMADGTLTQVTTTPDDANETRTTSTYAYEWWDGAKQSRVTTQATNPNAPGWRPATSYFNYDANGNLKSTYDDGGNDPGKARAFQYWTDLRGQVQRRDELTGVNVDANGTITGTQGPRKHNYYYLNGNRVGNQGNDGIDQVDYIQELAGKLGKGSEDQYKVFTPISNADFDENYMPINGTYPAPSSGQWTVRDGDTLQSVATAVWGDSSLWYILADANGLKSTDELRQGQLLIVPNKVTNIHNNATTFKPYDPGRAIGDTQPTLPAPPPPPGHDGCGGFASIISIIIAVAVSAVTYGAGAGPALAALGGAAASAASQGVMIAAGEQHGFRLEGVALGALGAGVGAGIGAAIGAPSNVLNAVAQGAARSVVTQGVGVVTGLQDRFDWRGVAASAIASGVGYGVGQAVGQTASSAGYSADAARFASGVLGGLSAGVASTLVRGGSLSRNIGEIATDAFASTVGNMVADRIQGASVQKSSTSSSTDVLTQQAIGAVNGQVLPGAIGGVGSGFMPLDTSYNGNVGLFGGVGGVPMTLDVVTSTAAAEALAAYRVPYSAATLLSGLGMGMPAAPTSLTAEPFETSFAEPRPGVLVAGDVWPSFGGSRARTDEAELTGAPDRRDWTSQTLSELAWKGLANGLGALPLGGGRLPPAGPGFALAGSTAVMGVVKAVAGLVPPALFNSGSDADAPSSDTVQRGGAHREVKGVPGYESHHMPADSISPLPTNQGPSIAMEINDHRATASWGSSREARAYRQQQSSLIEKGDFRAAQQMDIRDVQDKFGSKYNDAIRQMLEYMNFKGY